MTGKQPTLPRRGRAEGWAGPVNEEGRFARLDAAQFPEFSPGTVWLTGAGPGAAGLMTLLAYYGLGEADVVVYDALVNADILSWVRTGATIEYAGKRGGKPSADQRNISDRLIELANAGHKVLRLKGGDPFVFGRGGEEAQALTQAGIKFRIVPGISSGIGGLGYAGIPVTHREVNQSVLFLTGHDAGGAVPTGIDWAAVATASPVIVMYMAVKNLSGISRHLIASGRAPDDVLAIVSNATLANQSVMETTLSACAKGLDWETIPTPAVVVIGAVTGFRNYLDWYNETLRECMMG